MGRLFLVAGCLVLGGIFSLSATTRYVSRSGSNTPPYDTWEKATDSLGLAFKIANQYDTVRVAAGTFFSDSNEIIFQPNMVLLGAGRDSTHIIRSPVMTAAYFFLIRNYCQVKNVHMDGQNQTGHAIVPFDSARAPIIENNRFERFAFETIFLGGAFLDFTYTRIVNNIIENCGEGIDFSVTSGLIQGNTFRNIRGFSPLFFLASPYVTIANNSFINCPSSRIDGDIIDSGRFVNNLVDRLRLVQLFGGFQIDNNIFRNMQGEGFRITPPPYVANNIYLDNINDFYNPEGFSFQNFHQNDIWRTNGTSPDTVPPNNYFFDPMFVDSFDWKLQFASPAIDTGDTTIFDLDGTRSDLGIWGGPWGKITSYPDLAPRTPLNFSGLVQPDSTVILSWKPNTEADLGNYLLFRDTISGVPTDSAHLWATLPMTDSVFSDGKLTESRFYKLVAIDAAGNSSNPTSEVALITTGVGDEPGNLPRQFQLHQNYPNPFNSTTLISYTLSRRAQVRLEIFSIAGQLVKVLVDEEQAAGSHRISWEGEDSKGRPMPSGIYLYKLSFEGKLQVKKMVLVK